MQQVASANPDSWTGAAAAAARARRGVLVERGTGLGEQLDRAAAAHGEAAGQVASLRSGMGAAVSYARSRDFQITDGGAVVSHATGWSQLDPRRAYWRVQIWTSVQTLVFRINAVDVRFAARLAVLAAKGQLSAWGTGIGDALLSGAQFAGDKIDDGLDWSRDRWEDLGELADDVRDTAGEHLAAFGAGVDRFLDAAGERPRWLEELLDDGQLPSVSEVLATGAYLTGLGGGAVANLVTGEDQRFFDDRTPFVGDPRHVNALDGRRLADPSDLMRDMWDVYSTRDEPGAERPSVQITVIENPGQPPRYIVAIPGTTESIDTWDGWTGHQGGTDWAANLKGVGYGTTSSTQAVMAAIDEVTANHPGGTRPEIVLTGHSQGGIIAANLASDPSFADRYDIGGIMTAGSPIQSAPIPHDVPVINFDNQYDPVPKLDFGGAGGAAQPNVVDVDISNAEGESGLFDWHGQETYDTKIRDIMQPGTSQWLEDESPVHDFDERISRFYPEGSGTIHTYQVEVGRQ
ncbi:hypothetical protein FOJ82_10955 [Tessaracoccus rhinocerotis]|uniref:GPI inositol-deacylase PGAP1-like alpha/beta domain-containing protein n=1 Tax=Tessaracoccus rhinocerotis TaxID=1689449 RepID=A0A553JZA4_9ACTN|nr:hypothetical protein [Tessaracoccus rhinocerotis]TRY17785.1 hypothetical protein FOJ82_10955 [Tessaracoccus rhinocerotis]